MLEHLTAQYTAWFHSQTSDLIKLFKGDGTGVCKTWYKNQADLKLGLFLKCKKDYFFYLLQWQN